MYNKLPNLVIGFHGCSQETYKEVIYYCQELRASNNVYDWLGNGIYFWENNPPMYIFFVDVEKGQFFIKGLKK